MHFLSFLYPLRLYQGISDHSGPLEIRLENGKKVLNTRNSNYSFGSLAKVFQLALRQMPPPSPLLKRGEVLMLGFGAGSVVKLLRENYHFRGRITGVDHDLSLLQFARRHFPASFQDCELKVMDARAFLSASQDRYDLIFIDLFIDSKVASFATSSRFLQSVSDHLPPGGRLYHNLMIWNRAQFQALLKRYRQIFTSVRVLELLEANQVIVASH